MLTFNVARNISKFNAKVKNSESRRANAGADFRFEILTYLVYAANCRKRVAVSVETIMSHTGRSKATVVAVIDWLKERGALALVPPVYRKEEEKKRCAVYQLTGKITFEGEGEPIDYLYVPPSDKAVFDAALAEVGITVSGLRGEPLEKVNGSLLQDERFTATTRAVHRDKVNGSPLHAPSSIYLESILEIDRKESESVGASACASEADNVGENPPMETPEKPGAEAAKKAGLKADEVAPILLALLKAGAVKYDTEKDKVLGMLAKHPQKLDVALRLAQKVEQQAMEGKTFTVNYWLTAFENEASRPEAERKVQTNNWQRQKLGEAYRLANPTREELLRNGAILVS